MNTDQEKVFHAVDIILIHDAPTDNRKVRKEQRVSMNTEEIEKAIKKNPKDTRNYFYLGNTLVEAGQYKKAIKAFKNYLKYRDTETSEMYQVYMHMAICYRNLKDHKSARQSLNLAKSIDPTRRDAYSMLADIYMDVQAYDNAIFELTTALRINPQPSRMFQNGATQTWDPHQKLASCYEKLGDIPKASAHLRQAITYLHHEDWIEKLKAWQSNKKNILIIDRGGSFTGDFFRYLAENQDKYNVVLTKQYDVRLCIWADYIWAEWANDDAYLCSRKFPEKTVIRLHGWEAYGLPHLWGQINWNGVKKVVFVAEHIKERMKKLGRIQDDKCTVIHNGVDTDKLLDLLGI
jgi:tetratricopeptide (TPR) repeat protein